MAGTFTIIAKTVSVNTSPPTAWRGSINNGPFSGADADLLAAVNEVATFGELLAGNSPPNSAGSYNIRFNFNLTDDLISVDGNPVLVSFNDLPAGFTLLTLVLNAVWSSRDGSDSFWFQFASLTEVDVSGQNDTPLAIQNPDTFLTMLDAMQDGFGFRGATSFPDGFFDVFVGVTSTGFAAITGTYEIQSFSFTGSVQPPAEPVTAGETVTAESDPEDPHPVDFTQVLTVTATDEDGNVYPVLIFDAIDFFHFSFVIPSFGIHTPTTLTITITSTQFSGSVTLGTLITIYFTSGSGIYTFVTGKLNDTVYIEADLPNTVDIKIPDPGGRTGFFGG